MRTSNKHARYSLCLSSPPSHAPPTRSQYTIDSVSLIPSVSAFLEAGTNSVHLTSALSSGAAIFNALSEVQGVTSTARGMRRFARPRR